MTNLLYVTVWGRGLVIPSLVLTDDKPAVCDWWGRGQVIPSLALTDDKPAVCDCLGQRSGHPLSGPDR